MVCEWRKTSQLFAASVGRRSEISQLFGLGAAEYVVMITAQHGGGMFPCKKVAREFAQMNPADVKQIALRSVEGRQVKKGLFVGCFSSCMTVVHSCNVIGQNAGVHSGEPFQDCQHCLQSIVLLNIFPKHKRLCRCLAAATVKPDATGNRLAE